MRIFITGSEGLIGRNLRKALVNNGHEVLGYDLRAKTGQEQGDINDLDRLMKP